MPSSTPKRRTRLQWGRAFVTLLEKWLTVFADAAGSAVQDTLESLVIPGKILLIVVAVLAVLYGLVKLVKWAWEN
jgi:hypothetical protein